MTFTKRNVKSKLIFLSKVLGLLSRLAFVSAGLILFLLHLPLLKEELRFQTNQIKVSVKPPKDSKVEPINKDFSLVIPKIQANAKVLKNVDPFNSLEYQKALSQGVAHAKGTSLPDEKGNVFIFAHSSGSPLEAVRYNSIFYLLDKLEPKDEILLYYQGKEYVYQAKEKKVIEATDLSFLTTKTDQVTLTLMTCWPPGSTLKRMVWQADLLRVQ